MDNNFRSKAGWTEKENKKLFAEIKKAQSTGKPLNRVFEKISSETGRKPNSIRNYYYQKIKEMGLSDIAPPSHFTSFNDEEVVTLISTMLTCQAQGQSVRSCALEMGSGDKTKMLRYQNKYRSVLKTNPELVQNVMSMLASEGKEFVNPFGKTQKKRKSTKQMKFSDLLGDLLSNLQSSGIEIEPMFRSLNGLAKLAAKNAELGEVNETIAKQQAIISNLKREIRDYTSEKNDLILENAELLNRNRILIVEGEREKQKYEKMFLLLDKLLKTNREFLGLNEVTMVTDLSSYIQELSKNISYFEDIKSLG